MSKLHTQDELITIFTSILKNPDDCKIALKHPSSIFTKYGIHVPDPVATDAIIYTVAPQLRAHFLAVTSGKEHDTSFSNCGPKCIACKAGFGISLAALLPIALAGGAEALGAIAAIAGIVGVSTEAVSAIIIGIGSGGIGSCISDLCDAVGAC